MNDFRLYLQEELVSRCRKNPRYSLRSFSKALGTNHGVLSMILRGKRAITPDMVERFGLSLKLSKQEVDAYLRSLPSANLSEQKKKSEIKKINQLTIDAFNIVSDWYHDAIMELSRTRGFKPTPEYISKRIGITTSEARAAIERLARVGLIEINDDGTWTENESDNTTIMNVNHTSQALRAIQKQVLALSANALETVNIEQRDHTCITMAIDPRDIPEAKERIKEFRRELMTYLQRKGTRYDEVYQLAISLYPISKN